ncbi:hypothetical protein G7Y79_00004g014260 [Physcia stellaris]|nr:hypothetical protein G7Y79_00004g014260 [Physcia stellaris]
MKYDKPTATTLLKKFLLSLKIQCASLAGTRVCSEGETSDGHFVTGLEGAQNDCGVSDIPKSINDWQQILLDRIMKGDHFIAIDIKSVCPWFHAKEGVVKWSCKFTRSQSVTCQIVIIANIHASRYVAVIPMHYVRQKFRGSKMLRLNALKNHSASMLLASVTFAAK